MQKRPFIHFTALKRDVEISNPGKSLLEHSLAHKIPHLHECGGNGLCTTCRVRVIDGADHLSEPSEAELIMRESRGWDSSIRLACQTCLTGEYVKIERLVWTSAEVSNLQLETLPLGIGEEKELALLFCDMRNFTSMADKHPNFDIAHMLNRFFTALGDPVYMNNGIIYQYAGDEIVAIFGTSHSDTEKMCMDALRCALGMTYAVERLNKWEFSNFNEEVKVGIGIHFGRAFIGNIGHPRHKQFAVIGDPVNVTSRIQSKNKDLHTTILASESVIQCIPENTLMIGKDSSVELKGKSELHRVFEVLNFHQPDTYLEVQSSIDQLLKDEESFAEAFYEKVFVRAPEVRQLFQDNMVEQGKMLTHMLRGIVYSLSRPEYLEMGLVSLGKQHEGYGVKNEHYVLIREILMETIEEILGDHYTESKKIAWERTIDFILRSMQGGG